MALSPANNYAVPLSIKYLHTAERISRGTIHLVSKILATLFTSKRCYFVYHHNSIPNNSDLAITKIIIQKV